MFEIFPIRALSDNYVWTLVKEEQAVVVDPGEAKPVLETLDKLQLELKSIVITHHHYDHTGGIEELKNLFDCEVLGPSGGHIKGINCPLSDNEEFEILGKKFIALATPGHTMDQLAYFSEDAYSEPILFCGDTLFSAGCGRVFEGTHLQMYNSLSRFTSLPLNTKVFCGHEYTLQNANFCIANDPDNFKLKEKIEKVKKKLKNNLPSVPTILEDEIECNIFLKAVDLKSFSKLRDLKDNF